MLKIQTENYIGTNKDKIVSFTDITNAHWAYYDIVEATTEHQYSKINNNEIWN